MSDDTSITAERGPFEMVPHWILHDQSVSALGVRLYLLLRQHADVAALCFPSRQRLAALLGVSLPTLDKAREQLVTAGALCMSQRRNENDAWLSTRYHVHWNQDRECTRATDPGKDISRPLVKNLSNPSKETCRRTNTHITNTQELELHQQDGFDEFWAAYPRKVGKKDARKAWAQAIRDTDAAVIISGAVRYRDDPNREDAYTAHPATWLRAGRWDDDPLPARATRATGGENRMANYQRIYEQINQQKGIEG